MSLYSFSKIQEKIKKESLPGSIVPESPFGKRKRYSDKETPRYPCFSAVFTVEAAVILPMLTCFFVCILFFFRVMQVQITVQKALDETGRQMAVMMSQTSGAELLTAGVLLQKELAGEELVRRYIRGGSYGISLLKSEFDENEINLIAQYQIPLPVGIFRVRAFAMEQRADCRRWTGWRGSANTNGGADIWVYIAESGDVYHRMSTCTYLALSVQTVNFGQIPFLRNEDGGKYHKCELCGEKTGVSGKVYITDYGDRYHMIPGCSGIRRTVFMVRLSEAGDRRQCSRCGAGRG